MDAEDKNILEFLKKNQALKVPEDFTSNVMNSIIKLEENKKSVFQINALLLALFMLTTILVSISVFYLFDQTIVEKIISPMASIFEIISNQFLWVSNYFVQIINLIKQNTFAIGIGFTLILLLSFDRLIFKRKLRVNLLSIV